jgi:two-component system cell cycle response regulator DivK
MGLNRQCLEMSYAPNEEEQKARAARCDDFVPKPYSPRQLLAKIRQYIPK